MILAYVRPRSSVWSHTQLNRWLAAKAVASLFAIVVLVMACTPGDGSPTARPTPMPAPPSLRSGAFTFDGHAWTFSVVIDPGGSKTEVVLDWGPPGRWSHSLPVGSVAEPGRQSLVTTAFPNDSEACARFRATNQLGEATLNLGCFRAPVPSLIPGASPSPS